MAPNGPGDVGWWRLLIGACNAVLVILPRAAPCRSVLAGSRLRRKLGWRHRDAVAARSPRPAAVDAAVGAAHARASGHCRPTETAARRAAEALRERPRGIGACDARPARRKRDWSRAAGNAPQRACADADRRRDLSNNRVDREAGRAMSLDRRS